MTDQHEGDGRTARCRRVSTDDKRRGHIEGVALLIETAGNFDLLHLFFRRHVESERFINEAFLLRRRFDKINPDDFLGDHAMRLYGHGIQGAVRSDIGSDHGISSIGRVPDGERGP